MNSRLASALVLVAGAIALYLVVRHLRPGLRDEYGPIAVTGPGSIPITPIQVPPL